MTTSLGQRSSRRALALTKRRRSSSVLSSSSSLLTSTSGVTTTTSNGSVAVVEPPTRAQLVSIFQRAAIPMIGFGFVDQTIMLQAGHAIDCTIGVTFGLSTLTSAAFGQICSDASGAIFGNTLERLADKAGLPKANLTAEQKLLTNVQRTKFAGTLLGVIFGCTLGLVNLLLIDTDRSSTLKLQAFTDGREFDFKIEASNQSSSSSPPTTMLTVRGPDLDGVLASMTAALSVHGCSLVELHAANRAATKTNGDASDDDDNMMIEDVFHVVKRGTGEPFEDDELEDLAKTLLEATRTPMNVHAVKSKMKELEHLNANLRDRVRKLEQVVIDKQITIIPSTTTSHG